MVKRRLAQTIVVFALFWLATPLYAVVPWLHTDANLIKDPCGNTVVLRGVDTIDIGAVQSWYTGGMNALIDRVTNKNDTQGSSPGWYTKVIRLAIYPSDEEDFSSPFTFTPGSDTYYNTLLRPVVDYCKTKDIYAIIDWHYVGNNTSDKISQTSAFWSYMAPKFAGDSHVLFELFNEPLDNSGSTDTADWLLCRPNMQTWINIIRASAPNNLILVGGPNWSQEIGPAAAYPLTGDNIVMVVHIYPGHWLSSNQSWYTNHINTCLTRYPVFGTEWGFRSSITDNSNLVGTIANYGQPYTDFREARKMSSSAWVADYSWEPQMFDSSWNLLVGPGEMGGFTKDMLYSYMNADQPSNGDTTPPAAPTGLAATPSAGTVTLSWNNNTEGDLYGYDIYRSTTPGGETTRLNLVRSKTPGYTDTAVADARTYYYVVTAVDTSFNSSAYSIEASATVPADSTPPAAPSGVSATAGNTIVSLDWNNNTEPDVNGYNVYRSTVSGGPYTRLNGTLLTSSDYNDTSVTNGITYYYVVTAVDTSLNESANSSQVSATPQFNPIVGILGSWVTGTTHTKETGYNRALVLVAHADGAGSTADITSATYGGRPMTKIIYRRQGSSTSRVYVAAFILNDANIVAADSGGNFSVTWSATPTYVTYTSVFLQNVNQTTLFGADANNGSSTTSVSTSALSTSNGDMVIENAASSVAGTYTVTSGWTKDVDLSVTGYDGMDGHKPATGASETPSITQSSGNHSLIGFVVKMAPNVAPAAPTGLSATSGIGIVMLNWNNNTEFDLAGYNVYRSTTSGSGYAKLNSSLLTSSDYNDSNVSNGMTYYYVVTAVDNGTLESGYSGEVSATPNYPSTGTGAILREWWTGITGTAVSDLTSDANYPDNSTGRELITKLQGPTNWADNYGTSIRGYVIPPADGNYTFWIAGADSGELWLGTNSNPASTALIAYTPGNPQSSPKLLASGQKYYVEVLHKAGIGNDNISVSWQGPALSQQVIDGLYLSPSGLDFRDFADLAAQWNRSDCNAGNNWCSGEDRNRDGNVWIDDLATFAGEWLLGIE